MNRIRPARVALAVAGLSLASALLTAAGCASSGRKAVGGPGYAATGSVAYGTFERRGEAQLAPASPLVSLDFVGDTLLARTNNNQIYGLSGGLDIRYLRQLTPPGVTVLKPVAIGGQVIYATPSEVMLLDATGNVASRLPLVNPLTSGLAVDPRGLLLAGTAAPTGGRAAIIDPKNQRKPVRQETLIGAVVSAPAALQGVIYAANIEGNVFGIGDENRATWPAPFRTGRTVTADVLVDDFAVYVAASDTKLYALDRTTGRIKWRYLAETPLQAPPYLTNDHVYQAVPSYGVVAIPKKLAENAEVPYRKPEWLATGATRILGADDKYLYCVMNDRSVAAIDLATGEQRFSVKGDFEFYALGADKTVYTADRRGHVQSFARAAYVGEAADAPR